ncbi:D-glycero-alpha-D-manno-heptose-1,7-bisphosphate 7-phosphatase [Acetohalobium arabaticum]|uniref:D,D-heptose 1,7-bisphosphate phosphatase n=1 Tax=Acetohalobium arabaticum (strain ATCC 49924 / DSM 5501 / Z-7288) TaxID=574087 RepID=D9QTK8_ACEAZ|nr:HAD family hydrolase [Acetohalobium arabaticum]ADL11772.1 hydrolase, HAD-superfamily, subfamily IIIA [Acetohalobium arabaticum DSM 5501]
MKDLADIAVFMDRDGTVSKEIGYVNHGDRFELLPRTSAAVKLLNNVGIKAILATNQAGVARGYFPEERINEVHDKLKQLLAEDEAYLDAIYYCKHHPDVGEGEYNKDCNCRKPKPGMLKEAAKDFDLDLEESYMIGDKISDIEMAKRVGATGILVLTGYGQGVYEYEQQDWPVEPDYIADDLFDAVDWILKEQGIWKR